MKATKPARIHPERPHLEWDAGEGCWIGRDPRTLDAATLRQLGIERQPKLAAIRANCLGCAAGSAAEVRRCGNLTCPLWPFRMGTDPGRPPATERQRAVGREAAARMRAAAPTAAG